MRGRWYRVTETRRAARPQATTRLSGEELVGLLEYSPPNEMGA
jgi:hypothetical protein